jgi:hypothetical protein
MDVVDSRKYRLREEQPKECECESAVQVESCEEDGKDLRGLLCVGWDWKV